MVIGRGDVSRLDIDPTYPPRQRFSLGFTLVEILVVMLIISITFGFAMLAVGDFGESRRIRSSAETFAQFVELMHERALLEASTIQIQLNSTTYTAQKLDGNHHWQTLRTAKNHSQILPKKTQISIVQGSKKMGTLFITVNGSGDMTPFKVYFGTSERAKLATISGDENGVVKLQE